jgi:beta-aspartyl-peptidase (threonine type)
LRSPGMESPNLHYSILNRKYSKLLQNGNMKKLLIIISLFFLNKALAQDGKLSDKYVLVIHGGAGTILKSQMTPGKETAYRASLDKALQAGYSILEKGGTALDAVEAAVRIMEDNPLFNAGKGAVFTAEGKNELDAAIMNGKNLAAGSIAGVTTIRNPISAARAVMEKSPHVMLTGRGAETFAKEQGLEIVDPSYFFTDDRWKGLQRAREQDSIKGLQGELKKTGLKIHAEQPSFPLTINGVRVLTTDEFYKALNDTSGSIYKEMLRGGPVPDSLIKKHNKSSLLRQPENRDDKYGTVGAVALDRHGNLAAATSTGGMTNKKWNRVGDAPIIGAGTYANNATVAISGTGWGEYFIRLVMAKSISDMMEFGKWSLRDAAHEMIMKRLPALGGDGGLIAVDKDGNIAMPFCTEGMYRAYRSSTGKQEIKIYKED